MRAVSLVAFDFGTTKMACILDNGEASGKLSLKLLVSPWIALATAVAMLLIESGDYAPLWTRT